MNIPGIVLGEDSRVGKWVMDKIGGEWFDGRGTTVGLEDDDGALVAGAVYENYNERNCFVHLAINGRHKGTKGFLFFGFYYPFVQLGCERITGLVNSTNKEAVNLNIRLGFELEAVLYDACPNGHSLVYRMFKKDCQWLALGGDHGKQ